MYVYEMVSHVLIQQGGGDGGHCLPLQEGC